MVRNAPPFVIDSGLLGSDLRAAFSMAYGISALSTMPGPAGPGPLVKAAFIAEASRYVNTFWHAQYKYLVSCLH